MDCTFLRTDPSQLAFESEPLPEAAEVGDYVVVLRSDDQVLQRADCCHHNFIAAAECERHAMTFDSVARVGGEDYVGRGIVGVGMNCVGAGERSGSWGSDIAN